jgi:RimJ/RimL family protein N-acetyltransferase
MMNWDILEKEQVRLGAIKREEDAVVESGWTHDVDYMRVVMPELPRPLAASQMKKRYENLEKRMSESGNSVYFALRARQDDRLLGFLHFEWIYWATGACSLKLALGPAERNQGYGRAALELALNYAFYETNLHRVSAWVPADNSAAVRFFQRAGFQEEVRSRQAAVWAGQRYDLLGLGLLRSEWEAGR